MKKYVLFFVGILILAFGLRIYDLSGTPAGMHADEVSSAYNAYSILKTGNDEHGVSFPLYFEAFNDYKHPVYIYSMIPSLFFFGLTNFGARFTSVLFSLLALFVFYLLISKMVDRKTAVLSVFFLSITPWFFFYSRVAFEVISFCFLFLLALFLFFKGLENKKWLPVSALVFGLSLYAYGIARLFVPLFLFGLLWIYRKELFSPTFRKTIFVCFFLFILMAIPCYYASFFGHANARFAVVSVFHRSETPLLSFFINYFSHWSPAYLFFSGDSQINNNVTGWGELYHFALLLVPLGLYWLFKNKNQKTVQLLALWLLLFPLAASFTYGDLPHSARSFIGVPAFALLMSLGLFELWGLFHSFLSRFAVPAIDPKQLFFFFVCVVSFGIVFEAGIFFHDYFTTYQEESADYWLYFAQPTIGYMEEVKPAYEHIYLSKTGFDLFYISLLYHLQADPQQYQENGLKSFGYEICTIDLCFNESQKNLYVFRGFELTINGTHNIHYYNSDKIAVKFFG